MPIISITTYYNLNKLEFTISYMITLFFCSCYYLISEVLGAMFSLLVIWVLTGVLVYMAVERIIHKEYEINGPIMLATAVIGLFVNIW